jgi:hypothetical protein
MMTFSLSLRIWLSYSPSGCALMKVPLPCYADMVLARSSSL